MSKTITIFSPDQISWPACCAKCGTSDNLTWASATSGRVTSVAPTLSGAVRIKSELLDLSYPVCAQHASGLSFANAITRNTFGFKSLRGLTYVLGPMSFLFFLTLLLRLISKPANGVDVPLGMVGLYVIFAVALIVIIRAFRALPLRIDKQTENGISIKFQNDLYANKFIKLNRQHIAAG